LILLGVATVALTVILEVIDPSHVSHGPTILDFEFAGSHTRAAQIVAEWGPKGRRAAHLSLLLDYGYMLSYGLFFALAGFAVRDMARARDWRHLAAMGSSSRSFALAAATFDASENVALLLTLAGHGGNFAPQFAAVCGHRASRIHLDEVERPGTFIELEAVAPADSDLAHVNR
jgi:hypothetical protein